jgi:hypothetical protein
VLGHEGVLGRLGHTPRIPQPTRIGVAGSVPKVTGRLAQRTSMIAFALSVLVGCSSSHASGPTDGPLKRELQILKSRQNGLYFSPHLLTVPAGVQDISAALRTLELAGEAPDLMLAEGYQRKLRHEAIAVAPLLGRDLLVPIYSAGARDLLSASDAAEVRALRSPVGWFSSSAGASGTDDDKAIATEAALTVLDAVGQLTRADRAASAGWLYQAAEHATTLRAAAATRRALVLLGKTDELPPLGLLPPDISDLGEVPTRERLTRLQEAFDYAQAASAGGGDVRLDRTGAERLFRDNADATPDYGTLFQLSFVAFAVSRSADVIAPAIRRLDRAKLPDGSFRNLDDNIGSAIASIYVMRLLAAASEPVVDHGLAHALTTYAEQDEVRSRPAERLMALAAAARASGSAPSPELVSLCGSASVVPQEVNPANVAGWRELTTICHEAGVPTAVPTVAKWPISGTDQVVAAATLVVGLIDSQHADRIPSWVTATSLRAALDQLAERLPVLAEADLVRAYLKFAGAATAAAADIRNRANRLLGCTGLPSLYRASPADIECDLRTSWALRMATSK